MPRISVRGGASNAREGLDAGPSSAPVVPDVSRETEPTRAEDPHAPAVRPGEEVPFFGALNGVDEVVATSAGDVSDDASSVDASVPDGVEESAMEEPAPARPVKRAARVSRETSLS